ncbi:MAG: flagellar hook assembly protein FlgD [Burkholderiaceae bacterium]|nr:flagellar hook assembly protein FlgD [Rhodoferax sp.]MCP5286188.1 flagellar hook assembly protein FlgD [Burkholderiaceae bacterium]
MTTTAAVSGAASDLSAVLGGSNASEAGSADRFLKLLVTQLQNQDPLNPMDNAELTSQMAQINTVTGIENLNNSVQSMHASFLQMQALQGASLVGRDVTVDGNQLTLVDGKLQGGFSLAGPADSVQVEVLNPSGAVVDTLQLGAQDGGRHGFAWDASKVADTSGYTFRVAGKLGAAEVQSAPLMLDRVLSVGLDGSSGLVLTLERSGDKPYGEVHALN